MDVNLYVWMQGAQEHAASREMLAKIKVPAIEKSQDTGEEKQTLVTLNTDELVEKAFPGGKWHSVTFREHVTGADALKAESRMWVDGKYCPWLYGRAWVLTLVENWTFPEIRNEEGYGKLCEDAATILTAAVDRMRGSYDLPNSIAL